LAELRVQLTYVGYREEELVSLAEVIREHGFAVDVGPTPGGGGGPGAEVIVILTIGLGMGLGRMCQLFFEQAYDAWLREPLARMFFRRDPSVERKPILELRGTDFTAQIHPAAPSDIDAAIAMLPRAIDALGRSEKWEQAQKPVLLGLTYKSGTWRARGRRTVYVYRPDTDSYEILPRDQR
jgi:hypothetical protein